MSERPERIYIADARWYLTREGRAVPKGDPAALRLFLTPGMRLPWAEAQRVGLVPDASDAAAAATPTDSKALAAPPHTKALTAPMGRQRDEPAESGA